MYSSVSFLNREYRRRPNRKDLPRIVPAGRFFRVRHGYELPENNYLPPQYEPGISDAPLPSIVRFIGLPDFITVSDEWALIWVQMIQWASDYTVTWEESKQIWRSLIKNRTGFTDNNAPENGYRDPVMNENPTAENIAWGNCACTGNLLKKDLSGRIEALDFSKPPPPLDQLIAEWWKWNWATEIRKDFVLSSFPHIEVICGFPCGVPVPLPSMTGKLYINPEYIERVDSGKIYNIYERR